MKSVRGQPGNPSPIALETPKTLFSFPPSFSSTLSSLLLSFSSYVVAVSGPGWQVTHYAMESRLASTLSSSFLSLLNTGVRERHHHDRFSLWCPSWPLIYGSSSLSPQPPKEMREEMYTRASALLYFCIGCRSPVEPFKTSVARGNQSNRH